MVELCIAIAIMMLLAAMAIPGVNRARTAANEAAAIGYFTWGDRPWGP